MGPSQNRPSEDDEGLWVIVFPALARGGRDWSIYLPVSSLVESLHQMRDRGLPARNALWLCKICSEQREVGYPQWGGGGTGQVRAGHSGTGEVHGWLLRRGFAGGQGGWPAQGSQGREWGGAVWGLEHRGHSGARVLLCLGSLALREPLALSIGAGDVLWGLYLS